MELPSRDRGDELLRPGELLSIHKRLRNVAFEHDLATVIACAFDHRTRMLPFTCWDTRMPPAGVRAVGSAMLDAGWADRSLLDEVWQRIHDEITAAERFAEASPEPDPSTALHYVYTGDDDHGDTADTTADDTGDRA